MAISSAIDKSPIECGPMRPGIGCTSTPVSTFKNKKKGGDPPN